MYKIINVLILNKSDN